MEPGRGLDGLIYPSQARSRRVSSWDRTGGNVDAIPVAPGQTVEIAALTGAGCIRHLWLTAFCDDPNYLRTTVLRCYWDGEARPSVEAPLGDFFGVGHSRVSHYISLPLNMVTGTWSLQINAAAMNCFFPLPFGTGARLTVQNESAQPLKSLYYYVDYEEWDQDAAQDTLRFHAQWRRENPTHGTLDRRTPGADLARANAARNLDGRDNYVLLEAQGRGHYVGCNLSIDNIDPIPGFAWFGEGDDMIWIDEDLETRSWPPTLHGTGTEDYFGSAWGFPTGQYSGPCHGVSLAGPVTGDDAWSGQWTAYRFHLADPIHFQRCILVTIEHGHANCHGNDYSSTAYWYQTEPHLPFPPLPAAAERLPRPAEDSLRRFRQALRGER